MIDNVKLPNTNEFNEEFEEFIYDRINKLSDFLRKNNQEYIEQINKIEKIQEKLKNELDIKQIKEVNEIVDTLNYVSGIELTTAYKMAINDFKNLK